VAPRCPLLTEKAGDRRMSIEIKGEETPAMVAEILTLFILS